MKPPIAHLSVSSISDWLRCRLLWHGRRVAHWAEPPSPDLALGKAMHAAFESHHLGRDAETALMKAWLSSVVETNPPAGALARLFDALRGYCAANPQDRRDRAEVKFLVKIPDVPIGLLGYLDLIRGGEIQEFKTGRTKWTQERVDKELQATAYWYAYEQLIGIAPERVVYWAIRTAPTVTPPVRLETTRTPEQVGEFLDLARRVYLEMCEGDLRSGCPAGWCKFPTQCGLYR